MQEINREIEQIKQLREQGLTLAKIGEAIGKNYETVRRRAHRYSIIKPRNIKQRLSDDDISRFREDYLNGKYTNLHIASIFNISNSSLKRLRKRLELPSKYSDEYPVRAERIRQSIELYKKGMGSIRIGKKLGVDDGTVRGYLHKYGIKMREINGFTKNKITRQNKIIRELYPKGIKMADIGKKVGLKHHGIIIRLRKMGIDPNRNVYAPLGKKWDESIKRLFVQGLSLTDIGKKLNITISSVKYRIISHIFPRYKFKLKWRSKLNGKWRISRGTYSTFMELKNVKIRFLKYSSEFKIMPFVPLHEFRKHRRNFE